MILQRVLTAACLIPLVILGILRLDFLYFNILVVIFFGMAALEWAHLCHINARIYQAGYVIVYLICVGLLAWDPLPVLVLFQGSVFWLLPLYWILRYRGAVTPWGMRSGISKMLIGWFIIATAAVTLMMLRSIPNGKIWMIILLLMVWATDSFAYFAGKGWGRRALAPAVSPNKTWAGFWGGLVGVLIVALILQALLSQWTTPWMPLPLPLGAWLLLALGVGLLSVIGDLFESLMKRISGVKDSGRLFPGHGGILDRCDSLMATLPFYTLFLWRFLG